MQILVQSIHKKNCTKEESTSSCYELAIELKMGENGEDVDREVHDLKSLARNVRYVIEDLGEDNPFDGEFGAKKLQSLKVTLVRLLPYVQEMMLLAEQAKKEENQ